MSDFLARIAARAVGEPPAARPRLPVLLAKADADASPSEAVEGDDIGSPPPRLPPHDGVVDAAPAGRAQRADAPPSETLAEPAPRGPAAVEDEESLVPSALAAPEPPETVEEASPPRARRAPAAPGEVHSLGAVAPAPTPRPHPAPSPVARPAQAVSAVPAHAGAPRAPAATKTAPAREEPPPVRVHIGRLEVRASLEQPAEPERPRREPAASPELSLADYLRGRQETR